MLSTIGIPGLLLLLLLVLLLFGPSKLPQLGKAVGTTLHEFRSSARQLTEEDEEKQDAGRRQEG
ncbi:MULTISPECIES: twin-arginine translocase TatA/TatE family subunit [Paenibacillus]|uniref:Sec-independent protein translocase protein TatA n=2 Tax=Paenibacillus TaxID=44249 RepID=A0A1R1EUU8_9BACL|nr:MULTISPECIES: twin-arginine translocase TatA/TatE family subunit [Paenibacillus]OMF55558.1 Sec-independent protein translocase TatA [Paenibacillus rhizosphaerae]OXL84805.1 preprotein translocase subunit SecA [Paenibacillus sp. SSG-1]UYO01636.1 twin-arginine translocase TatA/TatE family subunit [Paenibacillus sp. PSB04]GIO55449.1 Sec-independent protein translocase protein TatA [Paenibacillus cineris]